MENEEMPEAGEVERRGSFYGESCIISPRSIIDHRLLIVGEPVIERTRWRNGLRLIVTSLPMFA